MQSQMSSAIATALAQRVAAGVSAAQIAATVGAAFSDIDHALTPIIGRRGVAALYKRSVHLAAQTHPWLAPAIDRLPTAIDIAPLTGSLGRQPGADAAVAGALLLQTFHDLLASLIGASLSERLLRTAWAIILSGSSAQDTMR